MPATAMGINHEQFAETLLYSESKAPGDVVADMAALRELDAHHEGKKEMWGTLLILGIVITVFAGLVALFASGPARGVGFMVLVAGGVASALLWAKKSHHRRLDVDNRRYQLVANLLPLLESDMADGAEVQVDIDFKPSSDHSKFERDSQAGRWKVKHFRDPWLTLSGRFVDGTTFIISVVHALQQRSCTKVSRSGKTKYKTKQKTKTSVTVRLHAKPDKYPRLPAVTDEVRGAVQLPKGAALHDFKVDGHRMAMKVLLDSPWWESEPGGPRRLWSGSHTMAMMLMSMYQVLNLARDIDERETAA